MRFIPIAACLAFAVLFAQGTATRNVAPAPKRALSSRPFPVSFVDVARDAGLRAPLISGDEQSKKYIIEANGTGVAFLDYDRDGRQDIFLVNGSKLDGFEGAAAPTNHLYRNEGSGKFRDVTQRIGNGALGMGQRRLRRRRHE